MLARQRWKLLCACLVLRAKCTNLWLFKLSFGWFIFGSANTIRIEVLVWGAQLPTRNPARAWIRTPDCCESVRVAKSLLVRIDGQHARPCSGHGSLVHSWSPSVTAIKLSKVVYFGVASLLLCWKLGQGAWTFQLDSDLTCYSCWKRFLFRPNVLTPLRYCRMRSN
jgi:hypothetical protein